MKDISLSHRLGSAIKTAITIRIWDVDGLVHDTLIWVPKSTTVIRLSSNYVV